MPKTTSKVSYKRYRCQSCGHEHSFSTNHYGEVYDRCKECSWSSPMQPIKVHACIETMPDDMERPEAWALVRLDDIGKVTTV